MKSLESIISSKSSGKNLVIWWVPTYIKPQKIIVLSCLILIPKSNAIVQPYFNTSILTKIQSIFLTIISRLVYIFPAFNLSYHLPHFPHFPTQSYIAFLGDKWYNSPYNTSKFC